MEEKNEYNKAYDEGYKAGKNDDFIQNVSHSLTKGYSTGDTKITDSYNAGYSDGSSDKGDSSNSNYSGGTSENSSLCFITTACIVSKGLPDDCFELQTLMRI
ncbi:hypothetical protein MASR2M39_10030 [Ignavibacteriales bacterium]